TPARPLTSTELYPLSLHDALPICCGKPFLVGPVSCSGLRKVCAPVLLVAVPLRVSGLLRVLLAITPGFFLDTLPVLGVVLGALLANSIFIVFLPLLLV